ncbi:MAG: AAA family ATPase [Erysipelotrichaceae bacterium]|nr:AAA family ATPase [Erysipelotrichaceae bacterium]
METLATSLVARFYKKISKTLSDWSAIQCVTTDVDSLPSSVKNDGKKAFVTVTGMNLPELEGCNVRYFGKWVSNKYGSSFRTDSYEVIPPNNEKGIISFLSSKNFPGIGKKTATAIVDRFGELTISIIENNPNKLLTVKGVTPAKVGIIVGCYQDVQHYSRLAVFLAPYGLSSDVVLKINKEYGKAAIERISDNPYILMSIRGVGFKTCDRIARGLNVALDSFIRIEGCTLETLRIMCESSGNMFVDINDLYLESLRQLNEGMETPAVDKDRYQSAFQKMLDKNSIVIRKNRDVFLYEYDQAEYTSAQKLLWLRDNKISESQSRKIDSELERYCRNSPIKLSEKQKNAVELSLKNRCSVITGGPGTGKSTITSAIISIYDKVFDDEIVLMAPTGKAARRMAEVTGRDASTIHSRLRIYEDMDEVTHTVEGLIIVDEVSMVDGLLLEKIAQAIVDQDCHLILVGDIDQLPSVGPGAILAEIIKSNEIPVTRLTEIFRQKDGGLIVENAIKINMGRDDLHYGDDFVLIEANSEQQAMEIILDEYRKEVDQRGIDNVALLSPLRKSQNRFTVVSDELNKVIQNVINPLDSTKAYCKFFNREYRVGDRVMQWKNCEASSNGDIGEILEIYTSDDEINVKIRWDNGNTVEATSQDLESIDLAYAMSVHKSQGSEYECVIIPMLSCQMSRLHRRNLFYTGVTRAKKKVILVGDLNCITRSIAQCDTGKRNSLLADRLIVNSKKAEVK